MAYFSNGTENEMYQERYCYRCVNYRADEYGESCPIQDAHWFAASEEGFADSSSPLRKALDFLIPMGEDHTVARCVMFLGPVSARVRARTRERAAVAELTGAWPPEIITRHRGMGDELEPASRE